MPISKEMKEAVLTSAAIELVRMFTVLSNQYSRRDYQEHATLLPEIEATMTACLKTIKHDMMKN